MALVCISSMLSLSSFAAAELSAPKIKVAATVSETPTLKVSWSVISGATHYYVYRSENANGDFSLIGKTTKKYYLDKTISANKLYYYSVKAGDKETAISDSSNVVSKSIVKLGTSKLTATATSSTAIKLSYTKADGANKYYIYMKTGESGKYKLVAKTSKLTYTVKNLKKLVNYSFKVRAVKTADGKTYKSSYSNVCELITKMSAADVEAYKLKSYDEYAKSLDTMGFNGFYDNDTTTATDYITRSEAIKLAICAFACADLQNEREYIGVNYDDDEFTNQYFVEYAESNEPEILPQGTITKKNYNDKITYEEFVKYFELVRLNFWLGFYYEDKELKSVDYEVLKNQSQYSEDTIKYFSDLVAREIIKVQTTDIDAKQYIRKAQANEIFFNTMLEYNRLSSYDDYTWDHFAIRNHGEMPKNYDFYPYVLENFTNSEYEMGLIEGDFPLLPQYTAKDLYKSQKQQYENMADTLETFARTITNVDYRTINYDDLVNNIAKTSIADAFINFGDGAEKQQVFVDYIKYVKKNHIIITSNTQFVEPCIYFDQTNYRARVKIEMEIVSADTRDNLLLYDMYDYEKVTYNSDKFTAYVDIPMADILGALYPYVDLMPSSTKYMSMNMGWQSIWLSAVKIPDNSIILTTYN